MSGIQKRLDSLQPYVIGIRYAQGLAVVDAVFKEGWLIPKSDIISMEKGDSETEYYMLYSQMEDIGVDELLDYVEKIININIERELKYELLKDKVKELKELFGKTSLVKLKTLKFAFSSEQLIPDVMSDDDIKMTDNPPEEPKKTDPAKPKKSEPVKPKKEQPASNFGGVELPPKKGEKIKVETHELPSDMTEGECDCGPDQACPKCIDRKNL